MNEPIAPKISVVVPVFNECRNLSALVDAVQEHMAAVSCTFELILVDDGSTDSTWSKIGRLSQSRAWLRGFQLSRNFGKEGALLAGFGNARGEAVITLDADLQHPVALIEDMVEMWNTGQYEIVEGIKVEPNRDSWLKEAASRWFYWVQNKMTGLNMDNASDFMLLDRKVVAILVELREIHFFYRGLCRWMGFRHGRIPFRVEPRHAGNSKWSYSKLAGLALTGVTSFTNFPLYIALLVSMFFFIGMLGLTLFALANWFLGQEQSFDIGLWIGFSFVLSTLFLSLGVIGIYLGRMTDELRQRPRFIIANEHGTRVKPYSVHESYVHPIEGEEHGKMPRRSGGLS